MTLVPSQDTSALINYFMHASFEFSKQPVEPLD